MAGGIDSFPLLAVPFFILAGNLMNSAGITNRIYDFAVARRRLDARRAGARQHHRLGDLRRHVGHGHRRRGRARHHRDQGHEGSWLLDRVRGRRHGRLRDARADHPAVAAVRDLRHDGQRLDRRAVPRRLHPGRGDDHLHDALRHLLRAPLRHGPRPGVQLASAGRHVHRRAAAAADPGHHHRRHDVRLVHADGSRHRRLRLGDDPRHLPLPLAEPQAVLQGHARHHRDDGGRAADRRRRLAVRLGADHHAAHRSTRPRRCCPTPTTATSSCC